MSGVVRARVDHCNFTAAYDIGTGAVESERPWVAGGQSADVGGDLLDDAVAKVVLSGE